MWFSHSFYNHGKQRQLWQIIFKWHFLYHLCLYHRVTHEEQDVLLDCFVSSLFVFQNYMETMFLSTEYLTVPEMQEPKHSPWIWGLKKKTTELLNQTEYLKVSWERAKSNQTCLQCITSLSLQQLHRKNKASIKDEVTLQMKSSLYKKTCDQLEMAGAVILLCSIISSVQSGTSKYLSLKWDYNFCPHDFAWPSSVQDTTLSNICNFLLP